MKQKLFSFLLAIVASTIVLMADTQGSAAFRNHNDESKKTVTVYQDCSRNAINGHYDKLAGLKFSQANVTYSYDQTTHKPVTVVSDTFVVATVTATGEEVYGCLIPATLNLFSEGFGYDDNGNLTGPSIGYIIEMHGYIPYIDGGMNPDLSTGGTGTLIFRKESDYSAFTTGLWKTADDIGSQNMTAGRMKDEAAYLTHIKAAVAAANTGDWNIWFSELDDAVQEGMTGGMMYEYTYNKEYQQYVPNIIPSALATNVRVYIESNPDSKYLYKVNGINAEIAPLGPTDILGETLYMGVTIATDEITGEMTVTSNRVEFDETVIYHSNEKEASPVVSRKKGRPSFEADELRRMIRQQRDMPVSSNTKSAVLPSSDPHMTLLRMPRFKAPQEEDKVTVKLLAEGCNSYSSAQIDKGETVSLKAEPKKYFKFLKWQDGNTDNPRQITLEEDKTYKACFTEDNNYTPVSAQLVSAENGNVTITWTVENVADNYSIKFESSTTEHNYVKNLDESEKGQTTFTYTLQMYGYDSENEETIKNFSIQARTQDGEPLGEKIVVTTDFTIPAYPYGIEGLQVNVDGIDVTVTWEKNDNVKFYYLIAYDLKAGYSRYEAEITGENTHTFKLYVESTYRIGLFSYDENATDVKNSSYRSMTTRDIEIVDAVDYSPYNLQLTVVDATATLEWDVPEGVDHCYMLIYDNIDNQQLAFERVDSDTRHYSATYTFNQPGTYSWSVVSGIENSSWFISVWKYVEPFEITDINPSSSLTDVNVENENVRKILRDGILYILMPDGTKYDARGTRVK